MVPSDASTLPSKIEQNAMASSLMRFSILLLFPMPRAASVENMSLLQSFAACPLANATPVISPLSVLRTEAMPGWNGRAEWA